MAIKILIHVENTHFIPVAVRIICQIFPKLTFFTLLNLSNFCIYKKSLVKCRQFLLFLVTVLTKFSIKNLGFNRCNVLTKQHGASKVFLTKRIVAKVTKLFPKTVLRS